MSCHLVNRGRPHAVTRLLTNGGTAFKWNLHCHWLISLWQYQIAVVIQGPGHRQLVSIVCDTCIPSIQTVADREYTTAKRMLHRAKYCFTGQKHPHSSSYVSTVVNFGAGPKYGRQHAQVHLFTFYCILIFKEVCPWGSHCKEVGIGAVPLNTIIDCIWYQIHEFDWLTILSGISTT